MYRWIGTVIPELIYMEGAEEVLEREERAGGASWSCSYI